MHSHLYARRYLVILSGHLKKQLRLSLSELLIDIFGHSALLFFYFVSNLATREFPELKVFRRFKRGKRTTFAAIPSIQYSTLHAPRKSPRCTTRTVPLVFQKIRHPWAGKADVLSASDAYLRRITTRDGVAHPFATISCHLYPSVMTCFGTRKPYLSINYRNKKYTVT